MLSAHGLSEQAAVHPLPETICFSSNSPPFTSTFFNFKQLSCLPVISKLTPQGQDTKKNDLNLSYESGLKPELLAHKEYLDINTIT